MKLAPHPALDAETLAISALSFLAEDQERIARFFNLTGIDPAEIRALAGSPAFFLAILDHLLSDEGLLLAFAANQQIRPESLAQARHSLEAKSQPPPSF